jgi:lycopene beta-cyclase
MAPDTYDMVFVGGGLAATLLLNELRPALPRRVAVVEPQPPLEQPPVHWSYWSREPTPYDRFAVGTWRRAGVAETLPESIAPFALRLVCSSDVFEVMAEALKDLRIEQLRTTARSILSRGDGLYEVVTDAGTVRTRWVFDSACGLVPTFPAADRPRAVVSGTGVRVEADRPVFDAGIATLFDPLDERSFAYLLPLSPVDALLESASFGPVEVGEDRAPLLRYLRTRHPEAYFTVTHSEYGAITLGFAPRWTTGPRHILIGTKRGLIKPSAGYGIVRIARESERLGWLWKQHRSLPPTRRTPLPWRTLDAGFVRLAAQDPRLPLALLSRVMGAIPLAQSLNFIDEQLPPRQLAPVLRSAAPVMLRKSR